MKKITPQNEKLHPVKQNRQLTSILKKKKTHLNIQKKKKKKKKKKLTSILKKKKKIDNSPQYLKTK